MKHEQLERMAEERKKKLGSRFFTFRSALNKSQHEIALEMETTQNLIFRLENELKVGTDGLFKAQIFYTLNYDLNPRWLYEDDNTHIPMYYSTDIVEMQRRNDADRIRSEILQEAISKLEQNKLLTR